MVITIIGAGRGIGRALAEHCIKQNHTVGVGVLKKGPDGHPKWDSPLSDKAIILHTDVRDEDTLRQAAQKMNDACGKIDIVVQMAGILLDGDRINSLLNTDIDEFKAMLDVNAAGLIFGVRQFYPCMRRDSKGKFIAITAGGGTFLFEDVIFPAYTVSKVAANKVMQIFKNEITDVEILAVHPGRVNTDMGKTTYQMEVDESVKGLYDILMAQVRQPSWFLDYSGKALPI